VTTAATPSSAYPSSAYKVLTAEQMATLERDGRFDGSPDDLRDGYVHLSTSAQLPGTLDRNYPGVSDLYLAEIDLEALGPALRWEEARGGQNFPHLYGPLLLETVVAYGPLERAADGSVKPPVAG